MINDFITGISRTLDAFFNSESDVYAIYSENIEQDLKTPCFIIQVVEAANTPLLNLRSKRDYSFDIVYISKSGNKSELLDIADKLFTCLKFITLLNEDKQMGFNMRYEMVDGVLHFFVKYPATMIEVENIPAMESVEVNNDVTR